MNDATAPPPNEDIAIVGMACIFPKADTPIQFWENIVHKVDAITDPEPGSLAERYGIDDGRVGEPVYMARGGHLGDLSRFNPIKYGVMPNAIDGAEPDQFLALRVAHEALTDAGMPHLPLHREKTGVFLGRGVFSNRGILSVMLHGFALDQFFEVLRRLEPHRTEAEFTLIREELKRSLPPFNSEIVPNLMHCSLTGRIANRYDLKGPTYTLDAACASGLIVVEHAMRELRAGRLDAALAGCIQGSTLTFVYQLFCKLGALARSGKIAPFSKEAQGTMLGEGCGMVVLKRRRDAERDGNRIYALLKEIATASDGNGAGLLAPRTEGQQLAIRRAYEAAGLPLSSVALVEAHGTGIPFGDRTEMTTLSACFGTREGDVPTIALGSVKSMIGHLTPGAAAASLIKTALAIYQRTLPPTLHAEEPHPDLKMETRRFFLNTQPRPWFHGDRAAPRRAGINAFGFGGINAHAILEEHPVADEAALPRMEITWPVELVVVSAADQDALRQRVEHLAGWVEQAKGIRLLDVAATCAAEAGPCRVAMVAANLEELTKRLTHVAKLLGQHDRAQIQDRAGIFWYKQPLAHQGRLAFVFAGAGSQYPHMLAELCRHFPEVRRQFDLTDAAYHRLGWTKPLSRIIFPLPGEEATAEKELHAPPGRMIAVMVAERGFLAILNRLGIQPQAVVGHSSGEFIAFQASGCWTPADDEALIQSMVYGLEVDARQAAPGLLPDVHMVAVGGASPEAVAEIVAASQGRLQVAIDNCPHQVVIAGDEPATSAALEQLQGRGALCEHLPVRALHTDAFAPGCAVGKTFYELIHLGAPKIELWSCTHAGLYPTAPAAIMDLAVTQFRCKLRFRETIQAMYQSGVRLFLEVGPRGSLAGFIADTLGKQPHLAVALDLHRRHGLDQLCRALGMLAAHGVAMDLPKLYDLRSPRLLDFHAAPPQTVTVEPPLRRTMPELQLSDATVAQWITSERGHGDSPTTTEPVAPRPVDAAPPTPVVDVRARALADYQQTMRQFLETQQRVSVTRFTGGGKPTAQLTAARNGEHGAPRARNGGVAVEERRSAEPEQKILSTQYSVLSTQPPSLALGAGKRPLPYLENILVHEPHHRLLAECELDVNRHRFLLDHTFFGRALSQRDPHLAALSVMPLAMMLELMAEAAMTLRPGQAIAALHDVRMHRWLAMETPTRRVRMEAVAQDDGHVHVTVFEADREGMSAALAEARLDFTSAPPDLGPPQLRDEATTPYPWAGDVTYGRSQEEVYGRIVFHGPAFRGIVTLDAADRHAARATVREPDPTKLLPTGAKEPLVLPAGLIDQCGQVANFGLVRFTWTAEEVQLGFPTRLARVEFAPRADRTAPLRAVVHMREKGTQLVSDVEMLDTKGRVVLRVLGREEEVARLPGDLYAYWSAPRRIHLTRPLTELFRADGCTVCEVGNVANKVLMNRLWAQALARMILSARERQTFAGLKLPPLPTASWLLGRAAVKDAARLHGAVDCCMADVETATDEYGRPLIQMPGAPLVSLAHKGFTAVAAAADPTRYAGVGIDVEPLTPLDAGVRADAFTDAERALLEQAAATGEPADHWYLSAWAAKEAVGKALGRGVLGGPRALEVVALNAATGRLELVLRGQMAEAFPAYRTARMEVQRRMHHEHVVALCLLALAA